MGNSCSTCWLFLTRTHSITGRHTPSVCVCVGSFPRSLISWGIVLERYLNNDLLTYSCQVCFKWIVYGTHIRYLLGVAPYPMACCFNFPLSLAAFMLSPVVCVCFSQHNHHADIDPMKCTNRIFEGQLALSPSSHHNVYVTFSHVTHNFQFSSIYVVFNACITVQLAHCVRVRSLVHRAHARSESIFNWTHEFLRNIRTCATHNKQQ